MSKIPAPKAKIKKPAPPPTKAIKSKTNYQLAPLSSFNRGKKIIVYGKPGMGKTSLCSLIPNSTFLSLDGGAFEIKHPVTGEDLSGIETTTYQETRNILQSNVFESIDTIIIDHVTQLERFATQYCLRTVKKKGGVKADYIPDYGYREGYQYRHEIMLLVLPDFDRWIRAGKNVILIAQESISTAQQAGIEDFVMDGPDLHHDKQVSTLNAYMDWADDVFRVTYSALAVNKGKVNPVKIREIRVHPDATFHAKARNIPAEFDVVEFTKPSDDSIWRLIFNESLDSV